MSINELCIKIEDLNKKIDEEPARLRRRKKQIEFEIEQLEKERSHAGLKGDFASVKNINFQIQSLKENNSIDRIPQFKSELNSYQNQLLDIIIDYYNDGNIIDDIIKIEDISENIYASWFKLSDFGKNSGYLFVKCINDDEYNWLYSNPINGVKLYSKTLDELNHEIDENGEVFLIFNNDLSQKSQKRDLIFYHAFIDQKLDSIDDAPSKYVIFKELRNYADKFSDNQISRLCDLFKDDYLLSNYFDDFEYILDVNDSDVGLDFYNELIDNRVNLLNDSNLSNYEKRNILTDLKKFADKFDDNQISRLCDLFKDDYLLSNYFDDFDYILDVNDSDVGLDFYNELIDNRVNLLNDSNLRDYEKRDILINLKKFADKFDDNQISRLCDLFKEDYSLSIHFEYLNYIININEKKIGLDFYRILIDNWIILLNDSYVYYSDKDKIFKNLKETADKFNEDQFSKFCNLFMEKYYISDYSEEFDYIMDVNEEKFGFDYCTILIDNYIKRLKDSNLYCGDKGKIFEDLNILAEKFDNNQINQLYNLFIDKDYSSDYFDDFEYILEINNQELKSDFYFNVIENKIDKLEHFDSGEEYEIMRTLKGFSDKFNENQLSRLCELFSNKYLYSKHMTYFNDILNANKELDNDFEEVYANIIDNSLKKLNNSDSDDDETLTLFENLKLFSKNFSNKQLVDLYEFVIENTEFSSYVEYYEYIFTVNNYVFEYNLFINNRIAYLNDIDSEEDVKKIMYELKEYKIYFNEQQLIKLCKILIENENIFNYSRNLSYILDYNKSKLRNIDEIYSDIIDSRIKKFNKIDSEWITYNFNDLNVFSIKFTEKQFILLCNIIKEKELMFYLDNFNLLTNNLKRFGDEIDARIYELIIDYRLKELELAGSYTAARDVLWSLKRYCDEFTVDQMEEFCHISITNFQVYNAFICTDNVRYILNKNKDLIDSQLYDEVVRKNGL